MYVYMHVYVQLYQLHIQSLIECKSIIVGTYKNHNYSLHVFTLAPPCLQGTGTAPVGLSLYMVIHSTQILLLGKKSSHMHLFCKLVQTVYFLCFLD